MKSKKYIPFALILMILLTCFVKSQINNVYMQNRPKEVYSYNSFEGFGTLSSLQENSDVIVIASIYNQDMDIKENSKGEIENVSTISDLKVNYVIKGHIEFDETLKVIQTGGLHENILYITQGVDLLEKNNEYILFLNKSNTDPRYYSIVSPVQGQVEIVNNKLKLKNDEFYQIRSSIFSNKMNKNELIEKIQISFN